MAESRTYEMGYPPIPYPLRIVGWGLIIAHLIVALATRSIVAIVAFSPLLVLGLIASLVAPPVGFVVELTDEHLVITRLWRTTIRYEEIASVKVSGGAGMRIASARWGRLWGGPNLEPMAKTWVAVTFKRRRLVVRPIPLPLKSEQFPVAQRDEFIADLTSRIQS